MSEIIFIYKNAEIPIQCSKGEKMKNILEKLCNKINKTKKDIYGLYNGQLLDDKLSEDQLLTDENHKKKIIIYDLEKSITTNDTIKSKEIICPKCQENCLLEIKDYNIILYKCKNNHRTILFINEFEETQKIKLSNIQCDICKQKNKENTYNNEFYKCINCGINICPLCKTTHNKEHNIINYDKKNIICNKHGEKYFGYCYDCQKNICVNCEDEDNNEHKIITYGKIIKNKNEILKNNEILRKDIDSFNNIIKEIINKLNMVMVNIEKLYEINKTIIENLNNKNKNYEILYNINNINNNTFHNDIKDIINEKDYFLKLKKILNICELMDTRYIKNDILIKYEIKKNDKEINLFGENFVKNNKNICKYIYENKEYELNNIFTLTNDNIKNDILEIKLTGIKNIKDMSNLFDDCKS